MVSSSQTIALYLMPMITGTFSLIGSATIAVTILQSAQRLGTPFKRIIFGLSIMDIIQSIAMISGPFSLPSENEGVLWSYGNQATCDTQGFFLHVGFAGVPMYMLTLTIYYLNTVKFNMKDKEFSKRLEPWLHLMSIGWTVAGGIACWISGSFNMMEAGNICWYSPSPYDCVAKDDVPCDRGKRAFTFGWIFGGSNFLTLCGIAYCLYEVCEVVKKQEARNDKYRFRGSAVENEASNSSRRSNPLRRLSTWVESRRTNALNEEDTASLAAAAAYVTDMEKDVRRSRQQSIAVTHASYFKRILEKSERRKKETRVQATLYVAAFFFTCMWAYLYGFLVTLGIAVPYPIIVLFSIFYPMGGVLNIMVYTRPKINTVRKKGLSWFHAFFLVVKNGADIPSEIPEVSHGSNENNSRFSIANRFKRSDTGGSRQSVSKASNGEERRISFNAKNDVAIEMSDANDLEEAKQEYETSIEEFNSNSQSNNYARIETALPVRVESPRIRPEGFGNQGKQLSTIAEQRSNRLMEASASFDSCRKLEKMPSINEAKSDVETKLSECQEERTDSKEEEKCSDCLSSNSFHSESSSEKKDESLSNESISLKEESKNDQKIRIKEEHTKMHAESEKNIEEISKAALELHRPVSLKVENK